MIVRTTVYSAVVVVAVILAIVLVTTNGHTPRGSAASPTPTAATQTITICKDTSPPGGAGFPFNWTAGSSGAQPSFTLNDQGCQILNVTFLDKYNTITEVVPPGWTLTNIACNSGTSPVSIVNSSGNPTPNPGGGSPFAPGDDTVAIDLNEANRTCTFTNTCSIAVCPTPSPTPTCPAGVFCTPTPTPSPTRSPTPTPTKTPKPMPTKSPTPTPTQTPTPTPCPPTVNCSPTPTPTCPAGANCTPTPTPTCPAGANCTPTPTPTPTPQPGSVTICKQTDPAGGTGFSFGWSSPTIHTAPFPLNGGHCRTFSGLNPADGPYSASEVSPLPAGWTLTNIVCTGGANIVIGANSGFDPGDTGVTINLGPGENITCTFTNTAPCATTSSLDISTGTAGIGAVDPIWTVSSAPNSVPTPDAYGVPGDYGPWVHPSSSATNWIDPNNTGGPPPGTFPPADPQGTYVFDTSFTAPANAQSFTLNFNFAADNNVKFYLNNVLIPGTTVNSAWSILYGVTHTVTNPSGLYTLTAKVVNGTGPVGLLVEGTLKCVLPTPRPIQADLDCDGDINAADFTFLMKYAAGLNDGSTPGSCPDLNAPLPAAALAAHPWGDINCDDLVDATDALHIIAHLAGIELPQPGGCTAIGQEVT